MFLIKLLDTKVVHRLKQHLIFSSFKQAILTKESIAEQNRLFIQQKALLNNEKLQLDSGKQGAGTDTLHNSVSQYVTLVSGWFL